MSLLATSRAATMADLFVAENHGLFNTLSPTVRTVMLTHYRDGDTTCVENGQHNVGSRVTALDEHSMTVETSAVASVTLRLLVQGRDTVVMAVETVATPYRDSRVSFYDTQWKPRLTSSHFKAPDRLAFLRASAPKDVKRELASRDDIVMIEIKTADDTLTAIHHLDDMMDAATYAIFAPYLNRELHYKIAGTKIKLIK